jgi:hypothetical protein
MDSCGFRHVVRMEWIKLRSLRSTRWMLAGGWLLARRDV